MKKGRQLAKALRECPRIQVKGVWYRSVDGAVFRGFYSPQNPMRPLWGLGAPKGGARFTPQNGPSSLYVADDFETAEREGLQVGVGIPLRPGAGVTRAVYTVEVDLEGVVDLREKSVLGLLGTDLHELGEPWRYRKDGRKAATQLLGSAMAKVGIVGSVFGSTKGQGACLVVFTDNLKGSHSWLAVRDGRKLLERLP